MAAPVSSGNAAHISGSAGKATARKAMRCARSKYACNGVTAEAPKISVITANRRMHAPHGIASCHERLGRWIRPAKHPHKPHCKGLENNIVCGQQGRGKVKADVEGWDSVGQQRQSSRGISLEMDDVGEFGIVNEHGVNICAG